MKSLKQSLLFTSIFFACSLFSSQVTDIYKELDSLKNDIASLRKKTDTLVQSKVDEKHPHVEQYDCFHSYHGDISLRFGGKVAEENFLGRNLNFLNSSIANDSVMFIRTTLDYYADFVYGTYEQPRLMLHSTFRFRHNWGSKTEVSVENSTVSVDEVLLEVKGTSVNKHLLWMQEAWLKIALGDTSKPYDHYLKLGLVPFEVGRGISLGAAYQQGGFLGFTPGFSIDQYAPGVLFHVNPIPKKLSLEFYVALLENKHTSFKNNNEAIRKNELDACPERGTSRHSYAVAMRGLWNVYSEKNKSLNFEPYIVYLQAPDQMLEFANDLDSAIATYGLAIEGKHNKLSWGFETAVNQGELLIKPWDRNSLKISRDGATGMLVEKYTKVFSEDPSAVKFNDPSVTPAAAIVTSAHQTALKASSRSVDKNGQEVAANLYNAFDRFRPKQRVFSKGFFLIADFDYQIIDDVCKIACGAGYASGDLNSQCDVNKLDHNQLLHREFSGFIPLQSVYSGKRLRHLVIFNRGIPRFNQQNPNGMFSRQNITPSLSQEKAEFTNIAFAGTKFEWKPKACKKQKLTIAPNLIFYWAPETPLTAIDKQKDVVVALPATTKTVTIKETGAYAGNFMGTELTTEMSAFVADKLKLYGYMGILFPGSYHKDMCGTLFEKQPIGHDVAFIANIGMNYSF